MRPIYQQQEELWRTKKRTNVRTRCAPVHRNPTATIAAPHAKAPARQSNLIAIVDTRTALETSDYFRALAQLHF
jgi:hypothetical protein